MVLDRLKEITLIGFSSALNNIFLSFDSLKFYQAIYLRCPTPKRLVTCPEPVLIPSLERASNYIEGKFKFSKQMLDVGSNGDPWVLSSPSRQFAKYLHSFNWMNDLCALNSPKSQKKAIDLTDSWITHFGNWNAFSWQADIISKRIVTWMTNEAIILQFGEKKQQQKRYKSLAKQSLYLYKTCHRISDHTERLEAALSLAIAGVCLPDSMKFLDKGLDYLDMEYHKQILPDGGHITRNPSALLRILSAIILLEKTMLKRGLDTPRLLKKMIDRIAPAIRFFTLSDGGLCGFHGSGKNNPLFISRLLKEANTPAKTVSYLPQTGFQKLESAGSTLIIDVGNCSHTMYSKTCHSSALAFEFSSRESRIIVNCGWSEQQPSNWQNIIRKTPAHSTLTLDNQSSSSFIKDKLNLKLLGMRLKKEPHISVRRNEKEQGFWLQCLHDGYKKDYHIYHNRNIYISKDGQDVRGEDRLIYQNKPEKHLHTVDSVLKKSIQYAIRFHLHPTSKASVAKDGRSVLIILENGDGWRFRTDSGPVKLEPSVYLAENEKPKRNEQIVIYRYLSTKAETKINYDANRTRWAIQKIGKVKPSLQETRT